MALNIETIYETPADPDPSPDWDFIAECEGGLTLEGYVPRDHNGDPLDKSGPTIGAGVDLGQQDAATLRSWGLDETILEAVEPYLGLRGWDAVDFLEAKPLEMSQEDAHSLTVVAQKGLLADLADRYAQAAQSPLSALTTAQQTVIVSLAFQYGPNLARRTPRFWARCVAGNWMAVVAELEAFGDKYPTRRRKEADLLKVEQAMTIMEAVDLEVERCLRAETLPPAFEADEF